MSDRTDLLDGVSAAGNTRSAAEIGVPGWIGDDPAKLFGVLHTPRTPLRRSTAVVIVPPFGWQELASHRARRYWATRLARAGFLTLRYDLPATGDSSKSPDDPQLFEAWVDSIDTCTDFLRRDPSVSRVAVFGIGLGGLLALSATARDVDIDDLLLWGVNGRGRAVLREMSLYAGIVTGDYAEDRADADLHGGVDLAGFFMSAETRKALEEADLRNATMPDRPGRRVLLVGRDGDRPDASLEAVFRAANADVETRRGHDFADLMTAPQDPLLRRPEVTIDRSIAWLEEASGFVEANTNESGQPAASAAARLSQSMSPGTPVSESIIPIFIDGVTTYAIACRPAADPVAPVTAVILGPGAIRKVGLHRMSVEIARRWAAQGVQSVRFDVRAVGDAAGPEDDGCDERPSLTTEALMSPPSIETVTQIIGSLRQRGVFDRFVTVGHCSGGYLAFQSAVATDGAVGCIAVNQPAIVHSNDLYQAQMFNKLLGAMRGGLVKRWRQNRLTLRELRWAREAIVHRLRVRGREAAGPRHRDDAILMLDTMLLRRIQMTLVATRGNGVVATLSADDFPDMSRWPNFRVEHIPSHDDLYHAIKMQRIVHSHLDAALQRVLDTNSAD